MAQRQAHDQDRPPTSTKQEFTVWPDTLGVRASSKKGGFGRIYPSQGVFNRFNGMRASLKLVNSILFFLDYKIMRPLWFQAELSYILTHSIKVMSQTIKTQNIPNSMLCAESGYEYNREIFSFLLSN